MDTVVLEIHGVPNVKLLLTALNKYKKSRYKRSKPQEWGQGRYKGLDLGRMSQATWHLSNKYVHAGWYSDFNRARLSFNCSQFKTFAAFQRWLTQIFGKHVTEIILDAKIYRIDLCVDIDVPLHVIEQALTYPRARCTKIIISKTKTIYLGQSSRQTYAYSKYLLRSHFDLRPYSAQITKEEKSEGSRIEVRHFGKYRPIHRLRDAKTLASTKPFAHLRLVHIPSETTTNPSDRKFYKLNGFLRRCEKHGIDFARKEFNAAQRNFARDIGRYLRSFPDFSLDEAWAKRCKRFFGVTHAN